MKKIITFLGSSYLAERRKAIEDHITLLESRYPEPIRREAVEALQTRLETIEGRKWRTNF